MASNEGRIAASIKLISIFNAANAGTSQQKEAIAALGRAGGTEAVKKLISIFDDAAQGSGQQLAAIKALGEAGRAS